MYLQVPSTSQSPMPSNTIHPAVESRTNSVTSIMQHAYRDLRASITGDHGSSIVSAIGRRMSTKKGVTFARPKTALAGALSRKLNGKSKKGEISSPRLAGYSAEELEDYRQVFQMFDTDGSGSIGIAELASAMKNLGLDPNQKDLETIIQEVDQDGNGEIDFDEFCGVMKRLSAKKRTWNEVVRECFEVFDRNEIGQVSEKDFRYILKEVGDIDDDRIIDDVFAEVDVDGNGLIDYDEFSSMVRNYMTDDDVSIHTNCTRFDTINFDYSVNRIDRQRLFPPQRDATYGTITMHDDSRDALCTIQH